jgi:hypothetical protein
LGSELPWLGWKPRWIYWEIENAWATMAISYSLRDGISSQHEWIVEPQWLKESLYRGRERVIKEVFCSEYLR